MIILVMTRLCRPGFLSVLALVTLACSAQPAAGRRAPQAGETHAHALPEAPDALPEAPGESAGDGRHERPRAPAPTCAPFTKSTQTGKLQPIEINEASGLAASWRYDGLLWTHNDSGDGARVFLIRPDGAPVAEVHLGGGAAAVDWEDIAVAPCTPGAGQSCVFVADTGDNLRARANVVIYRFAEPDLPPDLLSQPPGEEPPLRLRLEDVHATWFDYPGGPRDVETLLVHPHSGAIYVVEKNATSSAPVFRVPAGDRVTSPEAPARAIPVATLELPGRSGLFAMITAGDIAPDGTEFTVRTYLESYTYCAAQPGEGADFDAHSEDNFEDVFRLSPTRATLPLLAQPEALGYARDGEAIWLTSEGVHAPILRIARPAE